MDAKRRGSSVELTGNSARGLSPALEGAPPKTSLDVKKQTDKAYADAVAQATRVVGRIPQHNSLSGDDLHMMQGTLLDVFSQNDKSILLENLLMARLNQQYYPHHAVNVALLNAMIADALNLTPYELQRLLLIGFSIDLGMLLLPKALTDTKRVFTEEERRGVQEHVNHSLGLLKATGETDAQALDAVRLHHERYNGTGYPGGLQGNAIPLEARITAVADTFDAATSRKRYRTQKSPFEMLAEFSDSAGGALDPEITQAAVRYIANLLIGRQVILGDRSMGFVVDVDMNNLAYPLVRVVGRLVQTSPELPTVMLSSFMNIH